MASRELDRTKNRVKFAASRSSVTGVDVVREFTLHVPSWMFERITYNPSKIVAQRAEHMAPRSPCTVSSSESRSWAAVAVEEVF